MNERKWGRRWIPVAFVAVILAVICWWAMRYPSSRVAIVLDDQEFTLQAVTYGTHHRYVHGKPWFKALASVLPAKWSGALGLRVLTHDTTTSSLMVWGHWRNPHGTNQTPSDASLCDEHGYESEPIRPNKISYLPQRGESVVAYLFTNFPRRASTLALRIYERDNGYRAHRLGEIRIRNPARGGYPIWAATPLPISKQEGQWEFTLIGLTTGEAIPERYKPARGELVPWSTATFHVSREGQFDGSWEVSGIQVNDATGNVQVPKPTIFNRLGDDLLFGFSATFWPDEPAWKLMVEFSRTKDFTLDELWTAKSMAVPERGAPVRIAPQMTMHGVYLASLEFSSDLPPPSPGHFGAFRANGELILKAIPPTPGVRIMLSAASDDRGRPVRCQQGSAAPDGTRNFYLETLPETKTVDLTFAVQKSRLIEFLARPTLVSTNVSSK